MSASPKQSGKRSGVRGNPHADLADPHAGMEVSAAGAPIREAEAAVILLHGRNLGADSILPLADSLDPGEVAFLAPEAGARTWYPFSFLAPRGENERSLASAIRALDALVEEIADAGIAAERVALVGFSQGACLALEYVARRPRRYGGVAALIGGLFGPEGSPLSYFGALEGTPVFLCTSDPDRLVPPARVRESADLLRRMGARVRLLVEQDAGHAISEAALTGTRTLVERMLPSHEVAVRRV
jgi:phospholipase/carboxylesterase